ncbi:hypothetical protein [Limnothrix redekei]|uniref:Uncharacterized protein n=1 Tax=Limnothrix redekei LRLZ20PSL1 TaxID=3112953 RepID=A0ABW7CBF2_9CYAN
MAEAMAQDIFQEIFQTHGGGWGEAVRSNRDPRSAWGDSDRLRGDRIGDRRTIAIRLAGDRASPDRGIASSIVPLHCHTSFETNGQPPFNRDRP